MLEIVGCEFHVSERWCGSAMRKRGEEGEGSFDGIETGGMDEG